MKTVEYIEKIRRAHFLEHKTARQISRELKISRNTVRKALTSAFVKYTQDKPRPAPVLDPFKARIDELLIDSSRLPKKQKYTAHRIYEQILSEGYKGAESTIRRYVGQWRREHKPTDVYLPLEFDPGMDAQVDWGEGTVIMAGEPTIAQLFMMRLCYSRRIFVMAFPFQKQEAFLEGHVQAFHHFGGIPHRLTYDNLTTAVRRVLEGRNRKEHETFVVFRSHYLFESNFTTPGQAHQKGGIEHGVGFARRNFMVPLPVVESFEELNAHLLSKCLEDDKRQVHGQETTIAEAFQCEKGHLLPLPEYDFQCCVTRAVHVNPYSQVEFETNRYSVPVNNSYRDLVLKAYPFHVDILHQERMIATHQRCAGKDQDVIKPLHYLPLLEQRPGAFEYAKPMRRWREQLPPIYEQLLSCLRTEMEGNTGIREFLKILKLHGEYPAERIEQAVTLALDYGCVHSDGVKLCLRQLLEPEVTIPSLDLTGHPTLAGVGCQPVDLGRYEQLLQRR